MTDTIPSTFADGVSAPDESARADKMSQSNARVRQVDFYFDFISPFGWIAAERIGEMARAHNCTVNWRPFLLKATIMDAMGMRPVLDTPLKGPYLLHDAERQARLYGLQLHDHTDQIFASIVPARAVVWARHHAPDKVEPLVLALYRRWMRDAGDIASTEGVLAVAGEVGLDTEALAHGLQDSAIKDELREDIMTMIDSGIFGSPTIVVDGEMFWGSDRLEQAFHWLETGGW